MDRRIEAQGAIEVYLNQQGLIVIKQESQMGREEDEYIEMNPDSCVKVIQWLQEILEQKKTITDEKEATNTEAGEGPVAIHINV